MWIFWVQRTTARPRFLRGSKRRREDLNLTDSVQASYFSEEIYSAFSNPPRKARSCLARLSQNIFVGVHYFAEAGGFEPPIPFRVCRFSKPVISTTHPRLQACAPKYSTFCDFYQKWYSLLTCFFFLFIRN